MHDVWLIHKAGRGWYRPDAQGYTNDPAEAGRYTREEALSHSHPNGPDGPRDGISMRHETEVKGALRYTPTRVELLLLWLCWSRERELLLDLWANPPNWRIIHEECHRLEPYPAGYCDRLKYVSWAQGWGYGFNASWAGRYLFRRAMVRLRARGPQL